MVAANVLEAMSDSAKRLLLITAEGRNPNVCRLESATN